MMTDDHHLMIPWYILFSILLFPSMVLLFHLNTYVKTVTLPGILLSTKDKVVNEI